MTQEESNAPVPDPDSNRRPDPNPDPNPHRDHAAPSAPDPADADAPAAGAKKAKKPLRKRVSVWTLGLVGALCALVLAAPFLLSTGWVQGQITTWLNENIETPVHFDRMDVSWREGIRIEGLRVEDNEARPLLETPLVEIDAPLLPLLSRRLLVSKFVLHDPVIHIARDAEGMNTAGVVKKRRVRRQRRRKPREDEPDAPDEPEEHLVLPDIRVPVEIHDATLVFTSDEGEVRQEGIDFEGVLSTRDGPTTFRLDVPDSSESGLFIEGSVDLFDPQGLLLASDEREVDATILLASIDAARHTDLVSLFVDSAHCQGVADGRIEVRSKGHRTEASIDVTVRGLSVGEARPAAAPPETEVLLMRGRVTRERGRLDVSGLDVRAEGLTLTADLRGSLESVEGKADLDVDLGRAAAALRAMGIEVSAAFGGRIQGGLDFPGAGQAGEGRVIVSNFQAPSPVEGRPPVDVEHADLSFRLVPTEDGLRLEDARARIPRLEATASGTIGKDRSLDLLAEARGDLGAALQKVRDLGLLPRDLALNGQIDARVRAHRGARGDGVGFEIERFALTDPGVNVVVAGSRAEDGTLDVRAEGAGELQRLFAASGTSRVGGADVGALEGRFDFLATARGPRDALDVRLERLTVKGALDVEASGGMSADGALEGRLRADGLVRDVVTLLRRMGLVESDLPLEGRLTAVADLGGTRERPVVSQATVRVTGGQVQMDAKGSLDPTGAIAATVNLDSQVDALVQLAHAAGYAQRVTTPGGTVSVRATVSGTRDEVALPSAEVTLAGNVRGTLRGSLDGDGRVAFSGDVAGALRALAELESAWSGEDLRPLDGTFEVELDARGARDALAVTVGKATVRSRGLVVQADGARTADGSVEAHYQADGPFADLVELARQAGQGGALDELPATLGGTLSAKGTARLVGDDLQGSLSVLVDRLNVHNTSAGRAGGSRLGFSEERLSIVTEAFGYDLRTRRLAPMRVAIDMQGAPFHADIGLAAERLDADVNVDAEFKGALGPIMALAAEWTGAERARLDGTFEGRIVARGPRDRLALEVPRLSIRSDALTADVSATRNATGDGKAQARIRGPLADVLALAAAFGYAQDVRATGNLDAKLDGSFAGDIVTATLEANATDLILLEPDVGGEPFREPSVALSASALRYDLAAKRLDPTDVSLTMRGARLAAKVSMEEGDVPAGAEDPTRRVTADGRLDVDSTFSNNHPNLFPDVTLTTLSGPFRFDGDISRGREGAEGWTGDFDLQLTGATAPYARIESARAVGMLTGGALVLDPVTAKVNDGTATAKARLMLAGGPPLRHTAELHAQNVVLDAELAPLVARASPIFATGKSGQTGGRASIDVALTARGEESALIKRTLTGEGVLVLQDAYVESDGWLGTVLDATGLGKRLEVMDATIPFEVREGKVVTADLPIDAVGMFMKLGGEVSLDGDLDYRLGVKPKSDNSSFSKYAKLVDKDGFLPLRLGGDLGSPDLKLPSIKDVLGGGLGDLWDRLRGKDEDDDEKKEEERKRRRRERRKKAAEEGEEDVPPPPPAPR